MGAIQFNYCTFEKDLIPNIYADFVNKEIAKKNLRADNINRLATSEKYTTYLLFKPSKGSSTATYTWTDTSFKTVTTDVLSAGKGAWYYHRGEGFNLEIKKQF